MTQEAISIEPFQADMGERVGRLVVAIQRDEFKVPISLEDQPDLMDISGFYQKDGGGFWVAVTDDRRIVGTIALIDAGDGLGVLRKMFVAADYRGAKQGIAKRLLDILIDHARAAGFADIYLGSTAMMTRAHRFYEKNGFRKIAREELPAAFPVMSVDSYFCRLDLNGN